MSAEASRSDTGPGSGDSGDQGARRWFLIQTKPNAARIAERHLNRQGFATFLPCQPQTRRQGARFVTQMRPLFTGYMFVAFDPAQGHWRRLHSTQGVARLVCFGTTPAPVPEGLVPDLRERCDTEGCLQPVAALVPGDTVAIVTGPFAAFIARVEEQAADARVVLLLDLMGRTSRLELAAEDLRRV